ncbi:hypothetical protein GCM10008014_25750 [Paenibacillus silvae]|uniref:DUF4491 domain-containing protein n=1 Tax=Paenibacillus silvae TaxID=1325358 RepID=A0ABQ1ZC98_9BACL|nr:hypothetical protein [Paenibacillus silvae]GGH55800.1 hypothetical protein GCM10008014_25750 [Paenibacillus silvae]
MEEEIHIVSYLIGIIPFLIFLLFSFSHRYLAFFTLFLFWGGLFYLGIVLDVDTYFFEQAVPSILGSIIGHLWGAAAGGMDAKVERRAEKRDQRERAVRALERMANKK